MSLNTGDGWVGQLPRVAKKLRAGGWYPRTSPCPNQKHPEKSFACGARLFIAHKNLAAARRSTAGTRPSGRFSPEDEAARPQLSTSK